MIVIRIPPTASPEVQAAFRDVEAALQKLGVASNLNRDLGGRRFVNAGEAVDPTDLVTKRQLDQAATGASGAFSGDNLTVRNLIVRGIARFLGPIFTILSDAGVVYVDAQGRLQSDPDNLSYRYTVGAVRLGLAIIFRWHHGIEFRSTADVLSVTGENNDAGTAINRITIGPATTAAPALKRNGANLDVRLGDDSNYTDIEAATVTGAFLRALGSSGCQADKFDLNGKQTYTPSNVTTLRTGDFSSLSAADVRSVLGTLIKDLQTASLLG